MIICTQCLEKKKERHKDVYKEDLRVNRRVCSKIMKWSIFIYTI